MEDYIRYSKGPESGIVRESGDARAKAVKRQAEPIVVINDPKKILSVNQGHYPNIDVEKVEDSPES